MLRRVLLGLVWLGLVLGCGPCDYRMRWSDGDFLVYEIDTADARRLGYAVDAYGSRGMVGPTVVAVGSDERWIVVETVDRDSGGRGFYVVDKQVEARFSNEGVAGPYEREAFLRRVEAEGLPDFEVRYREPSGRR